MNSTALDSEKLANLRTLTQAVYILQAAGFLVFVTLIAGVIINYIKIDEARGTIYESHFRWQIRTFWWGLLWTALGFITFLIVIGWVIWFATAVWVIYRIVKGWLNLMENKPMYADSPTQITGPTNAN